jgi:hypothetical protein
VKAAAAGCPEKVAEELFGRDEVTVGDGYGDGHPVTVLKKWVDKIMPVRKMRAVAGATKTRLSRSVRLAARMGSKREGTQ